MGIPLRVISISFVVVGVFWIFYLLWIQFLTFKLSAIIVHLIKHIGTQITHGIL